MLTNEYLCVTIWLFANKTFGGIKMKKGFVLVLAGIFVSISLMGCGSESTLKTTPAPTPETSTASNVLSEPEATTPQTAKGNDLNIEFENGTAYFDITVNDFVQKYNTTLTNDAEYIANSLSEPQYTRQGTGLQQTAIYQYDVSNGAGTAVYKFVHTNENEKVLEVSIGIKKVLGKINVDLNTILHNDLRNITMTLSGCSQSEWNTLADKLINKIQNQESPYCCYYNGIVLDTYSNEQAMYFRVSCMSEEMYNNLIN